MLRAEDASRSHVFDGSQNVAIQSNESAMNPHDISFLSHAESMKNLGSTTALNYEDFEKDAIEAAN